MAKLENIQSVKKKSVDKPIHFVPNGKSFGSLEKMKKTFNPTMIQDEKELEKYLAKGNHVYCYSVSGEENDIPYCEIFWDKDRQTAMDRFYNQAEEL